MYDAMIWIVRHDTWCHLCAKNMQILSIRLYGDKYYLLSLVNTYLFFVSIVKQVFQLMLITFEPFLWSISTEQWGLTFLFNETTGDFSEVCNHRLLHHAAHQRHGDDFQTRAADMFDKMLTYHIIHFLEIFLFSSILNRHVKLLAEKYMSRYKTSSL